MQRIVCLAGILALVAALGAPGGAATAFKAKKVELGAFVRAVLPHVANNFAGVRGAQYDSDTYYVAYKVVPKSVPCTTCKIYDQYARLKYPENWYLSDQWNSKWTTARTEQWVMTQLRPVVAGYSLHRTVSYSYPTLIWRNAANTWVYVDFYSKGFTVRVGRDLPKALHVLSPPSKVQIQQLGTATANLMRAALPDATNNFASLRAPGKKKDILGEDSYPLNMTFGTMIPKCDVSDVSNGYGMKGFQPKWVLNCRTISMAGTKADLEETVRSAVYNALPSGYTSITDPGQLLLDDYRWDNSDSALSVTIGSDTYEKGIVSFSISIYHFLTK